MTDTSSSRVENPPQTNGITDNGILDDEDEKSKMRPADIDADMREMERRKRVEMIMNSRLFREELERIIEIQIKEGGGGPAGLLQQISDMMGIQGGRLHTNNMFKSSNCVVPINDIRGVESMGYAKGEKILRCKLAAVYRLIDLYGWAQSIYNHITARLNQDEEHFLINPFGMLYHEITASSLVKVDMQGAIVESGTSNFGVNVTGFQLHAAIHSARPDIKCIIHIHTPSVLAVSSLKSGLLPLCQESIVIGEVSQHPYPGALYEPEEKEKIARNLGPVNKVMFLTNHGAVCCGETIEEAFYNVYNTVLACETQIKLMPMGVDNLVLVPDETRKQIYDSVRHPPDGANLPPATIGEKKEKRWRVGGLEFEALMRMLDNAGFRTGYIYRQPLVKNEPPRPRNDVEVPPAVSSLGYLLEEEELYKQGNWKKFIDGRKSHDRTRWLNSPNVYQKVEILETGTPDPKKITKWVDANADEWVAEGSPTHSSTPVKIDAALQFVPKNTNPKEFKKLQQQIKENRRADKITSGPQSHILEGVSWEEAKKLQDANISQTGDQVILVGAASKGIIQRGFQHNATVYKAPYAKNPFDTVTDQELEDYKKVVTRKQKGESSYEEDQSESEALSSSAALPPTGIKSPASETEEESRDEPRVLRIETKTVPRPSQAEVVLSDDESDMPSSPLERSHSIHLPTKVTESDSFTRTQSLKHGKLLNSKDNPEIPKFGGDGPVIQQVKVRCYNGAQLFPCPVLISVCEKKIPIDHRIKDIYGNESKNVSESKIHHVKLMGELKQWSENCPQLLEPQFANKNNSLNFISEYKLRHVKLMGELKQWFENHSQRLQPQFAQIKNDNDSVCSHALSNPNSPLDVANDLSVLKRDNGNEWPNSFTNSEIQISCEIVSKFESVMVTDVLDSSGSSSFSTCSVHTLPTSSALTTYNRNSSDISSENLIQTDEELNSSDSSLVNGDSKMFDSESSVEGISITKNFIGFYYQGGGHDIAVLPKVLDEPNETLLKECETLCFSNDESNLDDYTNAMGDFDNSCLNFHCKIDESYDFNQSCEESIIKVPLDCKNSHISPLNTYNIDTETVKTDHTDNKCLKSCVDVEIHKKYLNEFTQNNFESDSALSKVNLDVKNSDSLLSTVENSEQRINCKNHFNADVTYYIDDSMNKIKESEMDYSVGEMNDKDKHAYIISDSKPIEESDFSVNPLNFKKQQIVDKNVQNVGNFNDVDCPLVINNSSGLQEISQKLFSEENLDGILNFESILSDDSTDNYLDGLKLLLESDENSIELNDNKADKEAEVVTPGDTKSTDISLYDSDCLVVSDHDFYEDFIVITNRKEHYKKDSIMVDPEERLQVKKSENICLVSPHIDQALEGFSESFMEDPNNPKIIKLECEDDSVKRASLLELNYNKTQNNISDVIINYLDFEKDKRLGEVDICSTYGNIENKENISYSTGDIKVFLEDACDDIIISPKADRNKRSNKLESDAYYKLEGNNAKIFLSSTPLQDQVDSSICSSTDNLVFSTIELESLDIERINTENLSNSQVCDEPINLKSLVQGSVGSESGYDADNEISVYHNGTALFSHFALTTPKLLKSSSDVDEGLPDLSLRSDSMSLDFEICEQDVNSLETASYILTCSLSSENEGKNQNSSFGIPDFQNDEDILKSNELKVEKTIENICENENTKSSYESLEELQFFETLLCETSGNDDSYVSAHSVDDVISLEKSEISEPNSVENRQVTISHSHAVSSLQPIIESDSEYLSGE